MKKNYIFYLKLLLIPIFAIIFLSLSGGRDGQYSGSPADGGQTCAVCHSGGSFGANAQITTNIPATGFVYGDTYQVTVSASSSSTKYGFQLCAEDLSVNYVGTYVAGTGNQVVNGGTHMTHTHAGNSQNSWTFDWTAPSFAEGNQITFYAAVNAADANGSTSGDQVVTASATYSLSSIGVDEIENISLSIYPNPSSEFININFEHNIQEYTTVTLTNTIGQTVLTTNNTNRIDVKSLEPGVYFLQLKTANRIGTSRFVKR